MSQLAVCLFSAVPRVPLSHAGKSVFSLTDPYCHLSSTILQLSFIVSSCDSYVTKEIPFLLLPHWLFFSAYHSWLQLLLRRINISICKAWITLALHLIFFESFALILTPSSHISLEKPLITQPTKAEIIFHHIPCRWLLIWYIHTQIVWEINLCVMAMKSAMSIKQQRVSEGKKVIWIRLCKCSALEEKKRFRAGFDASVIINIAVVYFNSFFYITHHCCLMERFSKSFSLKWVGIYSIYRWYLYYFKEKVESETTFWL